VSLWRRLLHGRRQEEAPPVDTPAGPDSRPRFGWIEHPDGRRQLIVFLPTARPDEFYAADPDTLGPVVAPPGGTLHVDVIGPHQTVVWDVEG
jgi:hypothetical protein